MRTMIPALPFGEAESDSRFGLPESDPGEGTVLIVPPAEPAAPLLEKVATRLVLSHAQLVVDENGEVVGEMGEPTDPGEEEAVLWVGPRLKRSRAKLAGLGAEKADLIRQINEHYDPMVNREKNYIAYLTRQFFPLLRVLAEKLVAATGGKVKTHRVGLLTLALRKKSGTIEVTDLTAALTYCKAICPEAVQVKESVLVSKIPKSLTLPEGASGMKRGEDSETFSAE